MNSILPDEPIPHTLNETLQTLISDFSQLDSEEQKLSKQVSEADCLLDHSSSDENKAVTCNGTDLDSFGNGMVEDTTSERSRRLRAQLQAMHAERDKIRLQNRLILCRLMLINQGIQEIKKDLSSPAEDDELNNLTQISEAQTPSGGLSVVDEYTRNYDVAGAVEDCHAYETLNIANYQSLLSNFNKTNEFD